MVKKCLDNFRINAKIVVWILFDFIVGQNILNNQKATEDQHHMSVSVTFESVL